MFTKNDVLNIIEKDKKIFTEVSDKIWEYAELSLKEYKSAALYVKVLKNLGFEVSEKVADIDTAFLGKYGKGRPYIAVLGEYDALSGLSQVGGICEPKELVKGGCGHGCGHNMLGAGALAAAYGIKKYLENNSVSGTVFFFGTPGEEGGAGKAFMAKEGIWKDLDCAITWHPADINQVVTGSCNSCIQVLYKFNGLASHAAGDPENGRSALDAVELMNVGVNYLREHTKPDARIHYAMIDGGGFSPNVVQAKASVLYMIRSELVKDANALTARVDDIAKGAALMTGTSFEKVFIDGCSNTVSNHTLEKLAYKNFTEIGAPEFSKEDKAFAGELRKTYKASDVPFAICAKYDEKAKEEVLKLSDFGKKDLCDYIAPLYTGYAFEAGSTDVGDVSWQTPALQINVATFPADAPGHSWQNVSSGNSEIGRKGMIHAGKVLAAVAVDLFENPETLFEAKAEFDKAAGVGYVCPIPENETAKAIEI